ncbi:MAG: glycosyltransferase family 39 protein [Gemmatales bacterium]|nr:glycosyltransferase family 39 protein [Gemmatales bacterium]MDW8386947.1 glycosyltransferase family 39 protein [Gemmatales bacterium]
MDGAEGQSSRPKRPLPVTRTCSVFLTVLLYVGSLLTFHLGEARTFTGHESLVAQIAREMLATGDWIVPRIAGRPWLEKPPLPHWCVVLSGWLLGTLDEFAARLPSVLAGLIGIVLLSWLTKRWFGANRGLLTGLILGTSYYFVTYSRLAEADIFLWTLIVGCLATFAADWVRLPDQAADQRSYRRWLFFALLGLTQLTKGPLFGAVLVLLPCLAFLAGVGFDQARTERKAAATAPFRTLQPFFWFLHPGFLLGIGLATFWPLLILYRYPDAAELWWMHTFGRLIGPKVLNPAPWWYYFGSLPWQLLPWTPCVLVGMVVSAKRAWTDAQGADRFLWLWFGTQFVFLSCVSAKHHHYLIHALPPCALWAAEGLERIIAAAPTWLNRVTGRLAFRLSAAAVIGLAFILPITLPILGPTWHLLNDALVLSFLGIAILLGLGVTMAHRLTAESGLILFGGLWLAYGWIHFSVTPKSDGYAQETEFLRSLNRWVPRSEPVYVLGLEPSRLLLYSPRDLEIFIHPREIAERSAQRGKPTGEDGESRQADLVLTSRGHEPQLRKFGQVACVASMEPLRTGKYDPFRELALYRVIWKPERSDKRGQFRTARRTDDKNRAAGP